MRKSTNRKFVQKFDHFLKRTSHAEIGYANQIAFRQRVGDAEPVVVPVDGLRRQVQGKTALLLLPRHCVHADHTTTLGLALKKKSSGKRLVESSQE